MAQYSVPTATLVIPGSFSRLMKLGYATTVIMGDIQSWCVSDTLDNAESSQSSGSQGQALNYPIVTIVKINDLNS